MVCKSTVTLYVSSKRAIVEFFVMKNKAVALLLCLGMAASLVACGGNAGSEEAVQEQESSEVSEEEPYMKHIKFQRALFSTYILISFLVLIIFAVFFYRYMPRHLIEKELFTVAIVVTMPTWASFPSRE